MSKKRPEPRTKSPESFESALGRLARIVSDLEDGAIGLEESLTRFEEGMRLLRHCHEVLSAAEQRIEELTGFDADGNPTTRPFDGQATIDQRKESAGRRQRTPKAQPAADDDEADSPQRLF